MTLYDRLICSARIGVRRFGSVNPGSGQSGQAMTELVISIITFLFVMLGIIQLAMVVNAYTMVRYAAYNAANAAIVHGGDHDKMLEAVRMSLLPIFPVHGRADHQLGWAENLAGSKATDQIPGLGYIGFFQAPKKITEVRILDREGRSDGDLITFDDSADADGGIITVEVIHRYELVVPLVNRILFHVYDQFLLAKISPFGLFGGVRGESIDTLAAITDKDRRTGLLRGAEFRIPLVAHYTARMQSDLVLDSEGD